MAYIHTYIFEKVITVHAPNPTPVTTRNYAMRGEYEWLEFLYHNVTFKGKIRIKSEKPKQFKGSHQNLFKACVGLLVSSFGLNILRVQDWIKKNNCHYAF